MRKIILVQPSERMLVGKKKKYGSIMPPLGLLSLAACIRKYCEGWEVSIMDYEVKNGDPEPDYSVFDIIGISGTTVHMPHAKILIESIRKDNKKACIVVGGPHATFAYSELLRDLPDVDAVIRGEGEISLVQFVNNYSNRTCLPEIKGVIHRNSVKYEISDIPDSLDDLPMCAYDLIKIDKYQLSTHRQSLETPFVSMMVSRGCPFSCLYCQTPTMFGNCIRYRSPRLVYEDIKDLKEEYGIKSIVFWDDTFTANRKYTLDFCFLIKDLAITWMCNTRVDRVDRELLTSMKNAGCRQIFFGIESFQENTLEFLHRTTSEEKVREAFELCKEVGIKTVGSLMIGTPFDDLKSIQENINKLINLNPSDIYVSIYNVTVGSKEFERAIRDGSVQQNIDWYNPKLFYGPPYGLPTVHGSISRHELQRYQKYAYKKFYGKDKENQFE